MLLNCTHSFICVPIVLGRGELAGKGGVRNERVYFSGCQSLPLGMTLHWKLLSSVPCTWGNVSSRACPWPWCGWIHVEVSTSPMHDRFRGNA